MLIVAASGFAFAGTASLASSGAQSKAHRLVSGWSWLSVSFAVTLVAFGPSIGIVAWLGLVSAATFAIVGVRTGAPKTIAAVLRSSLCVSFAALAITGVLP